MDDRRSRPDAFDDDALSRGLDDVEPAAWSSAALNALESRVLAATRRPLRWRRLRRRAAFAAVLLACFASGFVLGRGGEAPGGPGHDVAPPAPAPEGAAAADDDPVQLEILAAEADLSRRPGLLTRAGDLWLTRRGDIAAATRCYRDALGVSASPDVVPSAENQTWLFKAMLFARQ